MRPETKPLHDARFDPDHHYLVLNRRPSEDLRAILGMGGATQGALMRLLVGGLAEEDPIDRRLNVGRRPGIDLEYRIVITGIPLVVCVSLTDRPAPAGRCETVAFCTDVREDK